ncbi:hypothetical protein GGC63_006347 [Paenibacillus sp. OAS669]|nr:hypothetical protein [Paenibacillus sp. OAS669]
MTGSFAVTSLCLENVSPSFNKQLVSNVQKHL